MVLIPKTHPVLGQVGVAFVVPSQSEENLTLEDLVEFGKDKLANYKLPEEVSIIDELPLKNGFKIDRSFLKNLTQKENN